EPWPEEVVQWGNGDHGLPVDPQRLGRRCEQCSEELFESLSPVPDLHNSEAFIDCCCQMQIEACRRSTLDAHVVQYRAVFLSAQSNYVQRGYDSHGSSPLKSHRRCPLHGGLPSVARLIASRDQHDAVGPL